MSEGRGQDPLTVTTSDRGRIVDLTLAGGLLEPASAAALVRVAGRLSEDRAVRVVILRAAGTDFCPGPGPDLDPLGFDPDPAAALARLRPPVVAAVRGRCLSVGLELILATDIRLATPEATFGLPDLAAGRLPSWGGTQRLARSIRPAQAGAMVLLGTPVDGTTGLDLGLVHQVGDDPEALAVEVAHQLAARGPLALELAKEAVHRGAELPLRDGLRLEGDLNHQLAATQDRAEGLQAFFDKRPPDFAGR